MSAQKSSHRTRPLHLAGSRDAAVKDAQKAKARAAGKLRDADAKKQRATDAYLDGTFDATELKAAKERIEQERTTAATELQKAEATISALTDPDPNTLAAVESLRDDLAGAAADPSKYRELVMKLYEGFTLIEGPKDTPDTDALVGVEPRPLKFRRLADGPAVDDEGMPTTAPLGVEAAAPDDEPMPTFTYRERTYYLLPILSDAIYDLYGPQATVGVGDLIDRKGLPWRYASGPE